MFKRFASFKLLSIAVSLVAITAAPVTMADTFGTGEYQFDIPFVSIGNPGNLADEPYTPSLFLPDNSKRAGSVNYHYRMGKYEISRDMVAKANLAGGLDITLDPMDHIDGGPRDHMPATGISWLEAARFVNWLNTSTGHAPAYTFNGTFIAWWQPDDAGYNAANPVRNSLAKYVLPSVDEWHKAAYYDPASGVYYDYPTGSDTLPMAVTSGTAADTAVYQQPNSQGPADITMAGGLSPYGTMAQGGNVWEWEETDYDLHGGSDRRGVRGGRWGTSPMFMQATDRSMGGLPSSELPIAGFRVASVPEPNAMLLGVLASAALLMWHRRDSPNGSCRWR